jgi:5-hydroxyisourate hydrolase
MTGVSTHVLDLTTGLPAAGMAVTLERSAADGWHHVGEGVTDGDGRVASLGGSLGSGVYRLVFATGEAGNDFYPEVHVIIDIGEAREHHHIPLLLGAYGYTTYRGS